MGDYLTEIQDQLKMLIIESLNLEDLTKDDIDTNAPLFGTGLGLDSIDALELGIAIKKKFGVLFNAQAESTKQHFASVSTLASYIAAKK
jgi:acyl carrier protein